MRHSNRRDRDNDREGDWIDAYDFFLECFGFEEESIREVYDNIECIEGENGVTIKSKVNNKEFNAGVFEMPNIAQLRERVAELPPAERAGTFNLVLGEGGRMKDFAKVDVGGIQAAAENCGATFQVASNFNCLEFISAYDSARHGITKYVGDHTQGPAASISCAPATLYRNYFAPHSKDGQNYVGQLDEQIELVGDVPIIPITNGYVKFRKDSYYYMKEHSAEFDWNDHSLLKVGCHSNTQVTSGEKQYKIQLCKNPTQHVYQVFTAAINMAGVPWGIDDDDVDIVNTACFLLNGAYEGTFLQARLNAHEQKDREDRPGRNKCYLTLIGGGVFGNKPNWIVDAIVKFKHLMVSAGVDFYLVLFSGWMEIRSPTQRKRLLELVKETGGTIKQYE